MSDAIENLLKSLFSLNFFGSLVKSQLVIEVWICLISFISQFISLGYFYASGSQPE